MAWEVASKYYRELICLEPFPQTGEQTISMRQQQVSQVLTFKNLSWAHSDLLLKVYLKSKRVNGRQHALACAVFNLQQYKQQTNAFHNMDPQTTYASSLSEPKTLCD